MSGEYQSAEQERTELLRIYRMTLKSLQAAGEVDALTRSHQIDSCLRNYLETMSLSNVVMDSKLREHMRFYDDGTMSFEDWQDMIALVPLRLAVEGYPDLSELSSKQVEMLLGTAGDLGSERHDEECLITGLDRPDCFASAHVCSAKAVYELGRDLAAQFVVYEMGCMHANDATGMSKAQGATRSVRTMFAKGGLQTEEDFEEFTDRLQHEVSLLFRSDKTDELATE